MPPFIFVFAAMGITTWLYCEYLFTRKGTVGAQIASFFIGYLALAGICSSGWIWLSILPYFGVNWFLLRQNYSCANKTAILHGAFLTFSMIFSLELATFGTDEIRRFPDTFLTSEILPLLSWQLYYLVLSILAARFFKPHKQTYQEPGVMLLLCAPPVISGVVAMVLLFMGARQEISTWERAMIAIGEGALLAVNLLLFALYNHLEKAHAANLELQLSIQKERSDADYYQALKEQSENQRILIHDIKSHLHTLDALAQQEDNTQIRDYLQKLEASLPLGNVPRMSSEPILDMLLQRTRQECKKRGLIFHCDIREGCTGFMDAPSITALYGNLLSNAVEGADCSRGRTLELRVTNNAQGVVISLVNDCDTPPKSDGFGRLVTRKQDTQAHGVGLKSIDRVIRRYNGIQTVYYDDQSHQFHYVIHFPQA